MSALFPLFSVDNVQEHKVIFQESGDSNETSINKLNSLVTIDHLYEFPVIQGDRLNNTLSDVT